MRLLAARLRGHAAETSLDLYRRKFEGIAAELEEAALAAESRETRFRAGVLKPAVPRFRGRGSSREYER